MVARSRFGIMGSAVIHVRFAGRRLLRPTAARLHVNTTHVQGNRCRQLSSLGGWYAVGTVGGRGARPPTAARRSRRLASSSCALVCLWVSRLTQSVPLGAPAI
nr:hypothetical protein CFP56_79025 [Quercus suber]